MKGTEVPENYVFSLVLIKVDQKDITLSRLCYYLSESTRGPNTKTMFLSPCMRIYIYYLYVLDEGSLLPKYRDCTTSNDFELYIYTLHSIIYIHSTD